MMLDNETQRTLLLAAVNGINWPGRMVEEITLLKRAIIEAEIDQAKHDQQPAE
jgi:hypothetical protein